MAHDEISQRETRFLRIVPDKQTSPLGPDAELLRRIAWIRRAAAVLVTVIIVAGLIYFERQWLASLSLNTTQAAFWDAAFKGIGGLVAIFGAWLGVSKYFEERSKANRAALIEAQKPFSAKRQEVYFELVSATSTIGNKGRDDPLWREADTQFWWLFWGAVPMVADDQVGAAVNSFSEALSDDPDNGIRLRNASMDLAKACRKSLGFLER